LSLAEESPVEFIAEFIEIHFPVITN
jgi:hypothetical protein